jgi:L-xylulose reductase
MTDMGRHAWSDQAKSVPMLTKIPLQRFPEPREVAEAVVWLLSDKASMVNGQVLCVDGGFTSTGASCVPLRIDSDGQ